MSQPSRRHHFPPLTVAVAAVLFLLPPPSAADPYDEVCLSSLQRSLSPRNWTSSKSSFSAPCDGFISKLQGVTCNNGRVYKLSLPGALSPPSPGGGAIPPELSNCTNLQSFDLSSNALSGAIPPELSKLLNLAVLNLSANALSGAIPRDLASCAYLNVIDLHGNQLTGPIPDELGLLVRLSTFDVSSNRLSGPIPVLLANRSSAGAGTGGAGAGATAARFNASSFAGNKDLYGYPLAPMRGGHGLSVLTIVGIGLGSGLLSLVLSFSAVCIWLRSTDRTAATPGDEGKISHLMPAY